MSPAKDRAPAADGECYINGHSSNQNSKLPPLHEAIEYAVLARQLLAWILRTDSAAVKFAPIFTHTYW